MSATLRDVLAQRATNAGTPDLDIHQLVGRGEHRLRRRRVTAVLGAASAVVVVVALAVGAGHNGTAQPPSEGPVDHHPPAPTPARELVYSDVVFTSKGVTGQTIHLGSRVVETDSGFVHLDVTDEGFLYTTDGGAWFSDGGTPEQVGAHLCMADSNGEFSSYDDRAVMSANTGSLAAWFDCTEPRRPALVVFDTASRREVVRRPMALCRPFCELVDVTGGYVYFDRGNYRGDPRTDYRFDVATHELRPSTPQGYAEDLTTHPRALVVGDTWQTGTPTNGVPQRLVLAGSSLVPVRDDDEVTKAFDTGTRRALRLRLPPAYHSQSTEYLTLFEWLDDDTVALASGGGDILTCRLSSGRCVLAVRAPRSSAPGEEHRILPGFPLPG